MPSAKLGSDKYQFYKSFVWLDQEPNSQSPARENRTLTDFGYIARCWIICLYNIDLSYHMPKADTAINTFQPCSQWHIDRWLWVIDARRRYKVHVLICIAYTGEIKQELFWLCPNYICLLYSKAICKADIRKCVQCMTILETRVISNVADWQFGSRSSQSNDLYNWYLSLPSLVFGINRIWWVRG